MLQNHPDRPIPDLRRIRCHALLLLHDLYLSRDEASGKPGAVQTAGGAQTPYPPLNGSRTRSMLSTTSPSCMSSLRHSSQPAMSAAAKIIAS